MILALLSPWISEFELFRKLFKLLTNRSQITFIDDMFTAKTFRKE